MVRKLVATLVGITVLVFGASCSSILGDEQSPTEPSPSPTVEPSDTPTDAPTDTALGALSGTWQGVWNNQAPLVAYGTFTLKWAQQGDKVIGIITVSGSNCLKGGDVEGTVNGADIEFGVVASATEFTYSGRLDGDDKISGSYTSNCGGAVGTWEANRDRTATLTS